MAISTEFKFKAIPTPIKLTATVLNLDSITEQTIFKECDTDFSDIKKNEWSISNYWIRDNNDPRLFIYQPAETMGGPKMLYSQFVSDNFHLSIKFTPIIEDEKDNGKGINFIIYINDFYRVVIGDGNWWSFYMKQEEEYVKDIITNTKGPISLSNTIRLNEPIHLDIEQYVLPGSNTRQITVSLYYFPAGNKNSQPVPPVKAIFELENSSDPNLKERRISLGLLNSKTPVKTKFLCFKLKDKN